MIFVGLSWPTFQRQVFLFFGSQLRLPSRYLAPIPNQEKEICIWATFKLDRGSINGCTMASLFTSGVDSPNTKPSHHSRRSTALVILTFK